MSKKTNTNSQRLGLVNQHSENFQYYGKHYYFITDFFLKSILFKTFLKHFLFEKKMFLVHKNSWVNQSTISISIIFIRNNENNYFHYSSKLIFDFLYFLFNQKQIKIFFYIQKKYFSSDYFSQYIKHLQNIIKCPKKIFNIIFKILTRNLNQLKVNWTNKGPDIFLMQGFKIQLKGRFDNVKSNNMSKKITFSTGKMKTNSLKYKIDFLSEPIYSKLGACNLKLWVFYSSDYKINTQNLL